MGSGVLGGGGYRTRYGVLGMGYGVWGMGYGYGGIGGMDGVSGMRSCLFGRVMGNGQWG